MDFIIKYINMFLEKGVRFHIVLQMFALSLGHMFALIIPMAVLPATLMSFGNLASENEITAMKSSGISLYRLIIPGLVAASLLTVGLVYYNSYVLPETNHALMNLVIDITRKKPTVELEPNKTIKDFKGYSIFFREKNDRTGEINDVRIVKHASKGVYPTTINAVSGRLEFLQAENVLRFDLVDGEIHELPVRNDLSTYRHTRFKQYTINIKDVDRSLQRSDRKHRGDREMSVKMMQEKIDDIAADIGLSNAKIVKTADSAVEFAEKIGFPVVLKVIDKKLVHKSDAGGVYLDIKSPLEIKGVFLELQKKLPRLEGVMVQEMLGQGKEVILGMTMDPSFGPLIMFGLGGIFVETIKDVCLKIWPITDTGAREMVRSIRGFPLLEGIRGEAGCDLHTLAEVIQRISQLVGDHDRIVELDINPFLAFPQGGMALDARVTIAGGKSVYRTLQGP